MIYEIISANVMCNYLNFTEINTNEISVAIVLLYLKKAIFKHFEGLGYVTSVMYSIVKLYKKLVFVCHLLPLIEKIRHDFFKRSILH